MASRSQLPPADVTSCAEFPEAWGLLHRLLPAFIGAVCACGLLGNLLVLAVFLVPRRRLSVAEVYLSHLAASDLLFVLGLPFWAENIAHQFSWPFGALLCRVVNGVIKAHLFTSVFLVVAVSGDRYDALVRPVASRRRRRRRRAQAACLLVWAAGAVLSVPTFLFRAVEAVPELNGTRACVLRPPPPPGAWHLAWHVARVVELNVLGFLLPLLAILFFNGRILASLRGRPGGSRGRRAAGPLLALVAAFLVCWTPFHFFAFLDFLFQAQAVRGCFWESFIDLGLQYANFLAFLNSCLNPVIYVFGGRLFKARAWELCKRCVPGSRGPGCPAHRKHVLRLFWRK
ncbi:B1 bradykinin receptor [Hyaena hyaena]|uniref:B1 bradykinin receptor n=1 Tax=Hyaena hyaena TaxID=95912 RepID=UPI00192258FD|nr:B1 bradykinin receptor [Hyaena hyaena]